jgi:RNA polymerase sigma factor (sigma-70 family)
VTTRPLQTLLHQLRRAADPPGAGTPTDGQLVDRWVAHRDEAAFELLLWRHGPVVLAACRRLLASADAAEDAFQATWLVFLRKAGGLRRREAVAAWLHRVACRVALRARAAAARQLARERTAADVQAPPAADAVAWRDLRAVLDEEIDRLPDHYRRAFVLCCLQGQTHAEAARQLGRAQGTVSSWLARARDCLRGRLTRRGVTLGAGGLGAALAGDAPAAVPVPLVTATAQAAARLAAGRAATAGAVPAHVAALAEGVLTTMAMKKLAVTTALLVAAGLTAAAGGLAYTAAAGGQAEAQRPQAKPDPAAQPPKAKAADLIRGVVERAVDVGGGRTLLLINNGAAVTADQRTEYLIETGDDAMPGTLRDVLGKEVYIRTRREGDRTIAPVVVAVWPQPRAAAPAPRQPAARPEPEIAWGEPHNGLRVGIGSEGPAPAGTTRLVLALENVGKEDLVLNLGPMLNNGRKQYPSAIRVMLTDAKGRKRGLRRVPAFVAGRLDPFVVPLPAGGRYTLRYALADLTIEEADQGGARVGTPLTAGVYRAEVELVGKAVLQGKTNADMTGIALMPYWTGTIRSGEVGLTVPAAKAAVAAPPFDAVVWVPPRGPNRGLLYLVLTEPRANNDKLNELVVRHAGAALREARKRLLADRRGRPAPGGQEGKEQEGSFNVVFLVRPSTRTRRGAATGFSMEQLRQIRDADPERARRLASVHAWSFGEIPAAAEGPRPGGSVEG